MIAKREFAEVVGDPVPISALQHAAFCLRQAALIHLERLWDDNYFTAQGNVLHAVVDKGGKRQIKDTRRLCDISLASKRLNIAGKADLVEFIKQSDGREIIVPVEYKRGRPKLHCADAVQLCAQALCLEEMTGQRVEEGALFYWQTRRRQKVLIDAELRQLTGQIIQQFAAILASGKTPPPIEDRKRCRSCSLLELCQPDIVARPVKAWRARMVRQIAGEG
ncbi:CRISPR-associated protein Cas4 [Candidatus Tokpelaia sp.]|nr:CRISPR-associated protein Cas4 [Candidatus Tokpelaia sp.]